MSTGDNVALLRRLYDAFSRKDAEPFFDSMTEAASHEVAESVTDPDFTTWFDPFGNEILQRRPHVGRSHLTGRGDLVNERGAA